MKLIALEPQWVRYEHREDGIYHLTVDSLAAAQGVQFLCPKCFAANAGPIGTHAIIVWFRDRNVPDEAEPGAARPKGHEKSAEGRPAQRWEVHGTGFHNLSTRPSIALEGGCGWHGYVTDGDAA